MMNRKVMPLSDSFYDEFDLSSGVVIDEQPTEVFSTSVARDLATYSSQQQTEAIFRLKLIKFLVRRIYGGWTQKNLEPLLLEAQSTFNEKLPNWRTAARWFSCYRSTGYSIESLIPKHHKRGSRAIKKTNSERFYNLALDEKYLTHERPSVADAYQFYCDLIDNYNSGKERKVKPISKRTFYNRINRLPPYDVDLARYGKEYTERKYRTIGRFPRPSRVLERVEIDHTPLDLMLVDDELLLPIGRPYLTLLIDVYSKCVLGFYIGFNEPSYDSVRRALTVSCLSKSWVNTKYPDIKNEWPCEGKIRELVVDNGAEFWSKSLDDACAVVVSNIDYNRPGQPWCKPLIERFFGKINQKFLIAFPGKTFSNPIKLDGYKPEKDAVMRVSTFMDLFHKWIIDIYHYEPDSKMTSIPIVKWKESVSKHMFPVYRDDKAEKLKIDLAKVDVCALQKSGIHIHRLVYTSDELMQYRKCHPVPCGEKSLKLKVKTLHTLISHINVYLDEEHRYLKVPCVDPDGYTEGLSLFEHDINHRFITTFTESQVDTALLAESRLYLHNRKKEALFQIIVVIGMPLLTFAEN
ncbi:putative transposase [Photobacterium profundum SS9]|uniref:Transposase n=2 Tax=Photobacterium profundum TaxID=74109 RepID=Q6LTI6_PHOPR|nr:putative transposase [Photobacterium profundum SS9]